MGYIRNLSYCHRNVDDRLGWHAGNCSASDVLDGGQIAPESLAYPYRFSQRALPNPVYRVPAALIQIRDLELQLGSPCSSYPNFGRAMSACGTMRTSSSSSGRSPKRARAW